MLNTTLFRVKQYCNEFSWYEDNLYTNLASQDGRKWESSVSPVSSEGYQVGNHHYHAAWAKCWYVNNVRVNIQSLLKTIGLLNGQPC